MKRDEFNNVKITNERHGFSFSEFGFTQKNESTSFKDNKINIRDEINDNPTSNAHNNRKTEQRKKEEDQLREQLTKSSTSSSESASPSSSSGASSSSSTSSVTGGTAASSGAASAASAASATAATVASVSVVAVTTISTIVGINVYIRANVKMKTLETTPVSLIYNLDLNDAGDNKYIITVDNKENNYYSYQDLKEGENEGTFEELTPESKYTVSVIDVTEDNFAIYTNVVETLKKEEPEPTPEPEPEPEPTPTPEPVINTYTVTFLLDEEEYDVQTVNEGEKASRPEDPDVEGFDFMGWSTMQEDYDPFDFDTPINASIVVYAFLVRKEPGIYSINWDKSISLDNEFEYSIDYYDEGDTLSNFKLTLSKGDDTASFELPIGEGVQTTYLTDSPFVLYDGTEFDYTFTYDTQEEQGLVVESGKVTFLINSPGFNSFNISSFVDTDEGFDLYYEYKLSDMKQRWKDKEFTLQLSTAMSTVPEEQKEVIRIIDIETGTHYDEHLVVTGDELYVDKDVVYTFAIFIDYGTQDASLVASGNFSPYYTQRNKFLDIRVGGQSTSGKSYYTDGENTPYIPIDLRFNLDNEEYNEYDATFVYKAQVMEGSDVVTKEFRSPTSIQLQTENQVCIEGSRFVEADKDSIRQSGNFNLISIVYAAIEYNGEIIGETTYDSAQVLYEKTTTSNLTSLGARIDFFGVDDSERPQIELTMLHNASDANYEAVSSVDVTLYMVNDIGEASNGYTFTIDKEQIIVGEHESLITVNLYTEEQDEPVIPEELLFDLFHSPMNIYVTFNRSDTSPETCELIKCVTFYRID